MQTPYPIFDFLIHRPLPLMVLMALPLLFLAVRWGLFPSRRVLWLAAIPAIGSILMIRDPTNGATLLGWDFKQLMLGAILIVDAIIILLAFVDMMMVISAKKFSCTRKLLRVASQGKKHAVEIELANLANRGCYIEVKDDLPQSFVAEPEKFNTRVEGQTRTQFSYDFVAISGGNRNLSAYTCWFIARWGFGERFTKCHLARPLTSILT